MNDPNEQHDRPGHESIAASIERAAGAFTVPDPVALRRSVQSTFERRRRHRRTALTGVVGATALVAGLAVVAVVGDDGPGDRLMSSPAASVPEQEAETVVSTPAVPVGPSVQDTPATTVTEPGADSIGVTVATSQEMSDDAGSGVENSGAELFAWNGGFLAVRRSSAPQSLPEALPEELSAAFPQEVLDLFPDGLPATLDEATVILQEAGLYDVVSEIVGSNSDVRDALYADQPELITSVRFSTDGVDWTDVDADIPTGDGGFAVRQLVAGDKCVVVTEPAYDGDDAGRYYDVHVSTDLVQWDVQRLLLPERAEQRGVQYYMQLDGFAADESGWIAWVSAYADIDLTEFLPADLGAEVAEGRVATSYDTDGVVVDRFDENGEPGEQLTYTWEDLGLDGMPVPDQGPDRLGFVGEWGGAPEQVEVSESLWGIQSFAGGFVEFGEQLRTSPDGVEWTDVPLPTDGSVGWVLDTADGLLVSTDTPDGSGFHLLDPDTNTWSPVDLPGVPSGAQIESQPGGGAILLADYDEPDYAQPASIRLSAEVDGYAIEFLLDVRSSSQSGASYEVVDAATGEVILSESVDEFLGNEGFVSATGFETGEFTISDPDTGDVLVSFGQADLVQESLDENGNLMPEPDYESFESDPQHWVVAAVSNGLLVEEVTTESDWLSGAAVQGDTVLVALGDGSYVRLTSQ